jgi:hypothetical protein
MLSGNGKKPLFEKIQSDANKIWMLQKCHVNTNTWHLREKKLGNKRGEKQRVIIAAHKPRNGIMLWMKVSTGYTASDEILRIIRRLTEAKRMTHLKLT